MGKMTPYVLTDPAAIYIARTICEELAIPGTGRSEFTSSAFHSNTTGMMSWSGTMHMPSITNVTYDDLSAWLSANHLEYRFEFRVDHHDCRVFGSPVKHHIMGQRSVILDLQYRHWSGTADVLRDNSYLFPTAKFPAPLDIPEAVPYEPVLVYSAGPDVEAAMHALWKPWDTEQTI